MKVPEFLKDSTNVYRTEQFIVRQIIVVEYDLVEGANLCSYDTFFCKDEEKGCGIRSAF